MIGSQYEIDRGVFLERERLKAFYNNPLGIQELCDIVRSGGLLSKIAPIDDQKMVIAHNWAIEKLERIGLLDDKGLEGLIEYLLNREPTKYPGEPAKREE